VGVVGKNVTKGVGSDDGSDVSFGVGSCVGESIGDAVFSAGERVALIGADEGSLVAGNGVRSVTGDAVGAPVPGAGSVDSP
jgi:hypothetical protein